MQANLLLQIPYGCLQLRVLPLESGVRRVVDNKIRIHPVAFDEPLLPAIGIRAIDTRLSSRRNTHKLVPAQCV